MIPDNEEEKAVKRLAEINDKNKATEYSLGDVLLLNRFEKELKQYGWSKDEIKRLSPSYYKK